jgi:hypothetical protein
VRLSGVALLSARNHTKGKNSSTKTNKPTDKAQHFNNPLADPLNSMLDFTSSDQSAKGEARPDDSGGIDAENGSG